MNLRVMVLLSGLAVSALGQSPSVAPATETGKPEVTFNFERQGLSVPKFSLVVHEDGSGTYKGETVAVSRAGYNFGATASPSAGPPIDRPIKLSPATTELIFKTARSLNFFDMECASKAKNIADTGKKTLSYSGADGHGSCLYNFSENKSVTQLTEMFQAIAFTMDEGRKLDFMHRFDRLGLYSEIDSLKHEVEAKRAMELGNIQQTLESIVRDEALMEKVRQRAVALLNMSSETAK